MMKRDLEFSSPDSKWPDRKIWSFLALIQSGWIEIWSFLALIQSGWIERFGVSLLWFKVAG